MLTILKFLFILWILFPPSQAIAACAGTTRTWDADNNNNRWDQAPNWSGDNRPDQITENALIVSASRPCRARLTTSISCLEVTSGELRSNNNRTLTVVGDYFRSPASNSLVINAVHTNFWLVMGGTVDQTFEVRDPINNLRVSNNGTVTFTDPFSIRNELDLSGSTTQLNINASLTLEPLSSTLIIPSGVTVTVASGVIFTAKEGITVNGTLKIESGAQLIIGNGKTLNIPSGGRIELNGSSGNAATVTSTGAGDTFSFTVAGTLSANYFRIDRMVAAGLNVTGTLAQMKNGEFHNIANSGHAITLGSAALVPNDMDDLGFFDDDGHGNNNNIDASAFNVSSTNLDNYSGSLAGETHDTDGNNRIDWGSPAGTKITLSNNTASGFPPTTINTGSPDTLFGTFAFALTNVATATDITDVTLTMSGTASTADIASVKIYKDDGAGTNCSYDAGTDTQVGGDLTFSGAPATVDFSFTPSDVQTASDTDVACFHVLLSTSISAQDSKTITLTIDGTSDVTNSQSYSFSETAGPPVSAGTSTINGGDIWEWQGDAANRNWNNGGNWRRSGFPNSTRNCEVGIGAQTALMNITNGACLNIELQVGGTLDFDNAARTLDAYGSLTIESGFNFINAGSSRLRMMGAVNQSVSSLSSLPFDFEINNSGASGSNIVSLDSDLTVGNDVTITSGVLRVTTGTTLTVGGNLTVQTGAELEIESGASLAMNDGSTLTIDLGGSLIMVGSPGQNAVVTSTSPANAITVAINGNIEARYYTFSRLNTTGVTLGSTATIDGTNHLQDGQFSYPVNNNSTMLNLDIQVPTNTMDNTVFSSGGSTATTITNIDTTGASAGTLTLDSFSGDLAGPTNDTDPVYLLNWTNALNNLHLTQEASTPSTVDAGDTFIMGRFGFQQEEAGASFNDADLTQMKVTLTGTGDSFDVADVRIYYDGDCDGLSGIQIGSGSPSGTPASITFSLSASSATIQADTTSPPLRCIYLEYAMDADAREGKTIGAEISLSTDIANDQAYPFSASTSFPFNLGTPATINGSTLTRWTGTLGTDWHTGGNWTNGVPNSTQNCVIDNAANNPIINGGTGVATCKSISITSGQITLQNGTGAILEFYENFDNTGTITYNDGNLRASDSGSSSNQTLTTSQSINSLTFAKTLGGSLSLGGATTTISNLNFPGGSNFDFQVTSGKILIVPNGVDIASGTLEIQGGGELQIGAGQTLAVSGGTLKTSGTNDAYPQSTGNKGTLTVNGAGTWNFTATSGTVDLTGFLIDSISPSGVVLSGTTTLSNLNGGQLTNLSTSYSSVVGFQLNTPNLPATASNVGWNWGPNNTIPATSEGYTLAASTGCGGNTLTFDQWFGDFFVNVNDPDTTTKINTTSCTINIAAAASPVNLLSFDATPFDKVVRLHWETGLETDHWGFNVYRSRSKFHGYTQINNELVRNNLQSTSFHGEYTFDDTNLTNSTVYYYMIEDIAFNNSRKLHGPVIATPETLFGPPSSITPPVNTETNGDGDPISTPPPGLNNDGVKELGDGVRILSQTYDSLTIEVTPQPLIWTPSPLNPQYSQASISGFSRKTELGSPEGLQKTLLIPVDERWDSTTLAHQSLNFHPLETTKKLAPAPDWVVDGQGQLQPIWSLDTSLYNQNQFFPENNIILDNQLIEVLGQKFIRLNVDALRYNPVLEHTESLAKALIKIDLNSSLGSSSPLPQGLPVSAYQDTIRITFRKSGLYELTFDQLDSMNLSDVFFGSNPEDFRLYYFNQEIPIQLFDSDNQWNSGDKIRFYVDYVEPKEDTQQYLYWSQEDLLESATSPLRFTDIDGDPTGFGSPSAFLTRTSLHKEENQRFVLDMPIGPNQDHFFWKRIFAQQGQPPSSGSYFDIDFDLDDLDSNATVEVTVELQSRATDSVNTEQRLALWINAYPTAIESKSFRPRRMEKVRFEVPANYFIDGTNSLRLQTVADHLNADEFVVTDINWVRVDFYRWSLAINDQIDVRSPPEQHALQFDNFSSSNVILLDVSSSDFIGNYLNMTTQTTTLGHAINVSLDHGYHEDSGYRVFAIEENQILTPTSIQVQGGYGKSTLSLSGSDMVIIGPERLLNVTRPLIHHRESQGLSVQYFSLQQIYDEWSHGIKSSKAPRDFHNWANTHWNEKTQYVLFVGDADQDPKNHLGFNRDPSTQPYPFISGYHFDFGSDNYFVSSDENPLPFAAVGRLPSNDPSQITTHIQKIIDYETGQRKPLYPRESVMISDRSPFNENFSKEGDQWTQHFRSEQSEFKFSHHKLDDYNIDGDFTTVIKEDIFQNTPLIVNYLGHGAEDRWSGSLFGINDAQNLNHGALPIVSALNCLNSNFFNNDPTTQSLGETFVFNPEGGAIAFWGSSAMTVPSTQIELSKYFQERIYQALKNNTRKEVRLGDIINQAKIKLGYKAFAQDTINSWILLGDPALKIPRESYIDLESTSEPESNEPVPPSDEPKALPQQDLSGRSAGGCSALASHSTGGSSGWQLELIFFLLPILLTRILRRRFIL